MYLKYVAILLVNPNVSCNLPYQPPINRNGISKPLHCLKSLDWQPYAPSPVYRHSTAFALMCSDNRIVEFHSLISGKLAAFISAGQQLEIRDAVKTFTFP